MSLTRRMRLIIPALLALSACSPVYKLTIAQGNVISNDKLAQVRPGMSPDQVRFLLGTPLVVSEFKPNRWDYVYFYRYPDGSEQRRTVTVLFEGGVVAEVQDTRPPDDDATGADPADDGTEATAERPQPA